MVVVDEGGRCRSKRAVRSRRQAPATPVVVDGKTVVVVLAVEIVVVGLAVVVAALAVVAARLAVVVVRLAVVVVRLAVVVVGLISSSSSSLVALVGPAVVVVADWWHPGRPWPAGGLHVLPG